MFKQITLIITYLVIMVIVVLPFSCNQEINKSDKTTDGYQRFDYLIEQSKAFDYSFSFDTALLYSDSAYVYSLFRKDEKKMAKALLRKGAVLQNSNNLDSSKVYILKTIQLSERSGDSLRLALSLNTLGNTIKEMGEYDEALKYYIRAEHIYDQMGDSRRQAYVMLNIGNIYYSIQDYEKAIALYYKCRAVSLKADNNEMIRFSSFNIANIYHKLNKNKEAESAYLEVIKLDKEANDDAALALHYANLGSVYANEGKRELSLHYLNLGLEIAQQTKNTLVEIVIYNHMGLHYSGEDDKRKAKEYYTKSATLAKKLNNNNDLKVAWNNLSNLLEDEGKYEQALSYYKMKTALNDSLINERRLEIIYKLESKYEKKKDEAEILRLSNENAEKEIYNKDLKIVLVTVVSIVVLLIGILFFIRLKNRKDKIIAKQRIQQLEEEQKLMAAQSVIVGQENERKRVAQELHDGIGVLLSTASIHFSNVEESSADEKTASLLSKANKLLKQASSEVRKISHDMMPGVLSKFGLQEALEDIFENVEDTGSIDVDCEIDLNEERLSENTEIILYRIVQEILNNTLKHAHAKQISFNMKKEGGTLLINYKDDGDGFEQNNIQVGKSLGLSGIKSRIDFLKGEMKLVSNMGKGIQYDIRIPVG